MNGSVQCFGANSNAQCGVSLGFGSRRAYPILLPLRVKHLLIFVSLLPVNLPGPVVSAPLALASIGCGASVTCGILVNGSVICWGIGSGGALGTGSTADAYTPGPPLNLLARATAATGGIQSMCALLTTGALQCWGTKCVPFLLSALCMPCEQCVSLFFQPTRHTGLGCTLRRLATCAWPCCEHSHSVVYRQWLLPHASCIVKWVCDGVGLKYRE